MIEEDEEIIFVSQGKVIAISIKFFYISSQGRKLAYHWVCLKKNCSHNQKMHVLLVFNQ
jgi:hypothetical protein